MSSLRSKLLGLKSGKPVVQAINVIGVDEPLYVRQMRASERDEFENACRKKKGREYVPDLDDFRAKVLSYTVCDQDGNRLFSPTDIGLLADLPSPAVQPLYDAALTLNHLQEVDTEDAAKN